MLGTAYLFKKNLLLWCKTVKTFSKNIPINLLDEKKTYSVFFCQGDGGVDLRES